MDRIICTLRQARYKIEDVLDITGDARELSEMCFFSLNLCNMLHVQAYFAFLLTRGVPIVVMLTPGMVLRRQSHIKQTPHDTSETSV